MAKPDRKTKFGRRDEIDLVRVATETLASNFPNPERFSCPEVRTVEAVASGRLSVPDLDDVIDHIATCAPCFEAYGAYRKAYRARRNRKRWATLVAVLAVAVAGWQFGRKALSPKPRVPVQISQITPQTEILDYRNVTSERSAQAPQSIAQQAPHVRRALLNLQIRLPLGAEDGPYSIQFRNSAGKVEAQTTGTATWNGTTETLAVRIDLRAIKPGRYTLAIRKRLSWRQYSVVVD